MQTVPSSQSITIKISLMVAVIFLDIILNSFIEISFSLSFQSSYRANYYFIPMQLGVTAFIFVMMLVMLWQTFPLRYGQIFTLVKQFKWTFIVLLTFMITTAIERGIRLWFASQDGPKFLDDELYQKKVYNAFYFIRYVFYPIFYGFIINFCLNLLDPSYYKPARWLK